MRVTLGVTCFNASDTIERAMRSALAQTGYDTEVIAVDDCSTDQSFAVMQRMANEDSRVKLIRHEINRGYAGALNTILSHASGDFVSFFDDDDQSVPDRVATQIARIEAHEQQTRADLVLCYSNRDVVRLGCDTVHHVTRAIGRTAPEPAGPMVADHILGLASNRGFVWGLFGSCTLTARRSTFERVGPFDEQFRRSAELDFAIRAATLGASFIAVNRSLITQYKTLGADKGGTKSLRYNLLLRKKYREDLARRGLYLTSLALAHASFHGDRGRKLISTAYKTAGLLIAPGLIFRRVRDRLHRHSTLAG